MGSRTDNLPGGFLIPSRLVYSTLAANDGTSLASSYTESSPQPGTPVSTDSQNLLNLEVSNGQGVDLRLKCIKAGLPGLGASACQVAYRLESETTAEFRGWNPPTTVEQWLSIEWSTSIGYQRNDAVVIPSSQKVVLARRASTTSTVATRLIDTDLTVTNGTTSVTTSSDWQWPALTVLPTERILLNFGDTVHYSDDGGDTFDIYSESPYDGITIASTFGRTKTALYRDAIIMLVEDSSVAGTVLQLASSDLGATYTQISFAGSSVVGDNVDVVSTPAGVFAFYRRNADSYPVCRRLSSAFEPLDRGIQTVIASLAMDEMCATATPDGLLWVWTRRGGHATSNTIRVYVSSDEGRSFTLCDGIPFQVPSGTNGYPTSLSACVTQGRVLLSHSWSATTAAYDASLSVAVLGGWSNVTRGPSTASGGSYAPAKRGGGAGSTNTIGAGWVPFELPADMGFGKSGAGTEALSNGELSLSCTAQVVYYTVTTATPPFPTGIVDQVVQFEMVVDSGGSLSSREIAFESQSEEAFVGGYRYSLNLTTTGFRVADTNGSLTVGDVTVDLTEAMQFLIYLNSGTISTYYRRPGVTAWTVGPTGALTSAVPVANNFVRFGHTIASTGASRWRFFQYDVSGASANPVLTASVNDLYGRPIGSTPIPIGDAGTSTHSAFIAATSGPARKGAAFDADASHDYPVDFLFPEVAPSPALGWRSTSTAEQIIAFDLGVDSWVGNSIGVFVSRANFRTAVLERYSGGSWGTVGTLDLAEGFTSLSFTRSGDTIHPAGSTGGRYLLEGELVRGHLRLGSSKNRKVAAQTAGVWTSSTTATPEIRLEGVDGTEPASGSCDVVSASGVLVVHLTSAARSQYWRVRIPTQECPDDFFTAGALLVGRIQPHGARVDWSWSQEQRPNATSTRDRSGTLHVKQTGEPVTQWSIAWQDAANHRQWREDAAPDYVGPSGGLPEVAHQDVGYQLWGLVKELKSGEIPVVCIEEIPAATTTLTDPSRFLYGRFTSSVRMNNISGDLGTDEIVRVEAVTIDEIV